MVKYQHAIKDNIKHYITVIFI